MYELFWIRVKSLIKKNKTTQREAAAACGVSLRTFQNWIYNNLYPCVITGYYLARFLGVSVEYLVTGKEGQTKRQIDNVCMLLKGAEKKLEKISG
jgi:transcriptional regulator with XRE-family HTH domain